MIRSTSPLRHGALSAKALGQWIALAWNVRQKERELHLAAAEEFYRLYGEFFAIWKLARQRARSATPDSVEKAKWKLLDRTCKAEGQLEALLVRLSLWHPPVDVSDVSYVGRFREGYHSLRKAIAHNKTLLWSADSNEYQAFKQLACKVALAVEGRRKNNAKAAADLLIKFTSGHEDVLGNPPPASE